MAAKMTTMTSAGGAPRRNARLFTTPSITLFRDAERVPEVADDPPDSGVDPLVDRYLRNTSAAAPTSLPPSLLR